MTAEKAIKIIEIAIAEVEWEYPMGYAVAFETAIEALEKAEEYKRLEEQGLLLRLPCKVGDTVYIVGDRFPAIIESIVISEDNHIMFEFVEYERGYELTELWADGGFELEDIGKTVFLTREEAEQKLKEMEE